MLQRNPGLAVEDDEAAEDAFERAAAAYPRFAHVFGVCAQWARALKSADLALERMYRVDYQGAGPHALRAVAEKIARAARAAGEAAEPLLSAAAAVLTLVAAL